MIQHEFLQMLPMNPILLTASELTPKCLQKQCSPALSRQLQTSSGNYAPNEIQNIQTFGNEMSKLLVKRMNNMGCIFLSLFPRISPQCLITEDFHQLLIHLGE